MAGATDSHTWSVQKDWDEAKLFFEITNFSDVRKKITNGQSITSKQISIGRSSFSATVYPSGDFTAGSGKVGVFLENRSKHTVVADCTASVGKTTLALKDEKIKATAGTGRGFFGTGWWNFMSASDVMPGATFVLCMDIKVKKEEIYGTNGGEAVNKSFISIKEVEDGVEKGMQKRLGAHTADLRDEVKQAEKRLKSEVDGVKGVIAEVKRDLKAEIGKVKTPAADFIPECLVCLESLETLKIVQCVQGHKICEPCSEKEEVVACPTCKLAFLGRDLGMEASVQFMIDGSPTRWSFIHNTILYIN